MMLANMCYDDVAYDPYTYSRRYAVKKYEMCRKVGKCVALSNGKGRMKNVSREDRAWHGPPWLLSRTLRCVSASVDFGRMIALIIRVGKTKNNSYNNGT